MVSSALLVLSAYALAIQAETHVPEAPKPSPTLIQHDLIRLARVEWQLRHSAVDQCPTKAAAVGIVVDFAGAYDTQDQTYALSAPALGDLPQVIGVIEAGPADAAGIKVGDEIVAIDGTTTQELIASSPDPALLADDIQDAIAASSPAKGITLQVLRDGEAVSTMIKPVMVCAARFFLKTDQGIEAYSDGTNIGVTSGIIHFTGNDDELALVMGHELAHVIADKGEPASLFGHRRMEDKADLLGAALAHCAGYDIIRSLAFWNRFDKLDRLASLRAPTHRSVPERTKQLREAVPSLACPARP